MRPKWHEACSGEEEIQGQGSRAETKPTEGPSGPRGRGKVWGVHGACRKVDPSLTQGAQRWGGHLACLGMISSEEGPGPISGLGEAMESSEEGGAGMQDGRGRAGISEQGQDRLSGALLWQVVHQSPRRGPRGPRAPWLCAGRLGSCMSYKAPLGIPTPGWRTEGLSQGPGMRSGLSNTEASRREASMPHRADQQTAWC